MIVSKILQAVEAASLPRNVRYNPYKARKPWPPDFAKLDPKYQFRLERRYRRRTKLKWTRPGWVKGVKLAQWGICIFVFGYGMLTMDFGDIDNPFTEFREWLNAQVGSVWTVHPQPPEPALNNTTLQSTSKRSV